MNPNCCHFIPQFLLVKAASWFEESIPLVVCWSEIVSLLAIVAVRKAIQLVFCAFELKNPQHPLIRWWNEWMTHRFLPFQNCKWYAKHGLVMVPKLHTAHSWSQSRDVQQNASGKGLPKPTHMLIEIWNQGRLNTTAFDGWLSKHIKHSFTFLWWVEAPSRQRLVPNTNSGLVNNWLLYGGSILVADGHYLSLLEVPFNQPIGYWATQVQDHPAVSSSWSKTSKRAVGWSSSLPIITFHGHPKAFPA